MMNPNNPQTPGVYTVEKNAFPPSVAQVPTAIPAFIGYTEKAADQGKSLINKPTLINSLSEYNNNFGGAPKYKFPIFQAANMADPTKPPTADEYDFSIPPHYYKIGPANSDTLFYLYNCLRLFYLNGGGPAYIVSVGTYEAVEFVAGEKTTDPPVPETKANPVSRPALMAGLNLLPLIQFPKPTMILMPDAMALADKNDCYMLQQQMIAQAGSLKDRVALLDIYDGYKGLETSVISDFRNNMGINDLSYAIAYYPWLQTEVVSASEITYANLASSDKAATPAVENIQDLLVGVPMLKVLDSISSDYETLKQDLLTTPSLKFTASGSGQQYTSWSAAYNSPEGTYDQIVSGQSVVLATMFDIMYQLSHGGSYTPAGETVPTITIKSKELRSSIELITLITSSVGLLIASAYSYEKNFPGTSTISLGFTDTLMKKWGWVTSGDSANVPGSPYPKTYPSGVTTDPEKAAFVFPQASKALKNVFDTLFTSLQHIIGDAKTLLNQYNSSLENTNKTYNNIMTAAAKQANRLPPTSAMAGIYTTVDNTLGVWNSPANRNIDAVIAPLVSINNDQQAPLNVDALAGKSINAIRSFYGRGPAIIWGARTMDGNSLDCRYVNVRRLLIMIEQSVANAAFSLVFEPNDASTWTMCESMISNFLHNLWSEGALQGSSPDDAYSVMVGLGKTMTPTDILNGIMRVQVKVAAVRPAEFIIITYEQEMPKP
ncbi:phage tail sheath C-terminal domain-containing protein [Lewinella cohaerens]|uniref:phage tail sheath C-terminal domain-containing protein n=1 Tax=Lewinella cohaerens TaxID=70995 RepID=UPI000363B678|nr:phage tail sheath C-terminal domain-containing protein [Lewinella cohaerens]